MTRITHTIMSSQTVYIADANTAAAVGAYIVTNALCDDPSIAIVQCDVKQDDGTYNILTLDEGVTKFRYDDTEMYYKKLRYKRPLSIGGHGHMFEEVHLTGPMHLVRDLINKAVDDTVRCDKHVQTFLWNARHDHWYKDAKLSHRTWESITLNAETMRTLREDIDDFTSADTKAWYVKHCIPFRRGYLFYGSPGTGKTSTILAIASHLQSYIYRVNLVAPGLTDDGLLQAVNSAKKGGIVVFEDVDALFGVHREKEESFSVTFSGLINAIDGLGDTRRGLMFVLTSNHVDRLDPALLRKGRVDLKVCFDSFGSSEVASMFKRFYPTCDDELPVTFAKKQPTGLSPAQVQAHFIKHRKSTDVEACCPILLDKFDSPNRDTGMWG